jgi:hypothetical protein
LILKFKRFTQVFFSVFQKKNLLTVTKVVIQTYI